MGEILTAKNFEPDISRSTSRKLKNIHENSKERESSGDANEEGEELYYSFPLLDHSISVSSSHFS